MTRAVPVLLACLAVGCAAAPAPRTPRTQDPTPETRPAPRERPGEPSPDEPSPDEPSDVVCLNAALAADVSRRPAPPAGECHVYVYGEVRAGKAWAYPDGGGEISAKDLTALAERCRPGKRCVLYLAAPPVTVSEVNRDP